MGAILPIGQPLVEPRSRRHCFRATRSHIYGRGLRRPQSGIMQGLIASNTIMEAERLNSLSALLADLAGREADLRRYL